MLESAESEHLRLTNREIYFEDFQLSLGLCDQDTSMSRTNWRTEGQTDDLLTVAKYRAMLRRARYKPCKKL